MITMALTPLEEEYAVAEARRMVAEARKYRKTLPPNPVQAEVLSLKKTVEATIKEVNRVTEKVEQFSYPLLATGVIESTSKVNAQLTRNADELNQANSLLQSLNLNLTKLYGKLDEFVDKQARQMLLEKETLQNLNVYLKNWV